METLKVFPKDTDFVVGHADVLHANVGPRNSVGDADATLVDAGVPNVGVFRVDANVPAVAAIRAVVATATRGAVGVAAIPVAVTPKKRG